MNVDNENNSGQSDGSSLQHSHMEHISDDSSRIGEFGGDVAAIGHLGDGNQRAVRMHVPKIPCQEDTFRVVLV